MGNGIGVLAEYDKVRVEYPEFTEVWNETRDEMATQCREAWGLEDGAFMPGPRQFGETTVRLQYFSLGTANGTADTWNRNMAVGGHWNTIINNPTMEDVYVGIVGWMMPNVTQRTKAIYQEFGQTKLPVIEYEAEIDLMEKPAIIFEKGIVIPEETDCKVDFLTKGGYAGYNVVQPLGMAMVKPNLLIKKSL
jgi:hypothetical protein